MPNETDTHNYAKKKRWKERNPNTAQWLKTTLSGLIGTTLGIILTFGTRTCQSSVSSDQTDKEITVMLLRSMSNNINEFEINDSILQKEDSIMQEAYAIGFDGIDDADSTFVMDFLDALTNFNFRYFNATAEQIFFSGSDFWKGLQDRGFSDAMGGYFTMERTLRNAVTELNEEKIDIALDIPTDTTRNRRRSRPRSTAQRRSERPGKDPEQAQDGFCGESSAPAAG